MFKTEIICDACESHYIVVTKRKETVNFCPICSEPYTPDHDFGEDDCDEEGTE